ncbi:hypothetical protein QBC43DRAFT_257803 [Cladorrhinum sp. PSN259]|nr:hypothetical protein QBC43DRAFT_257803 [Cladorrhinum sp. PSN259]
MADGQIVLFDIPSKPPLDAWSLNPWKTRLILHFKGLDYRTEWLEYPEIAPRLKDHVEPWPANPRTNSAGTTHTIPTVILPSGEYIMDSRKIANRLEELYPSPPLHLDSPYQAKIESAMNKIMNHISPVYIPLIPKRILNEASHPHWYRTREITEGMDLDTLWETQGGQKAFDALEQSGDLQEVTGWLKENDEGPFFLGKEVSYADFVWVGFLVFIKRIGEEDVYGEILKRSGDAGVHERLLDAVKQWTVRNDH